MPQKLNTVFVSNEKDNNILNYKPQDTFRCLEVVYNSEVMEVLTSLDPLIPNYNKIPDALYPQNIQYLKTIKAFTKKEGHIVDYAKSCIKRGRYTPHNSNKKDYASLQGCYSKVRRLLCNGNLKGIDVCNCHIEIIKNLCNFLNLPTTTFEILNEYCKNRETILNDVRINFECDRKTAKEFFIIVLFGGNYNTWITNSNLLGKEPLITKFMTDFLKTFNYIKYEIEKLDVFQGFMSIQKQVQKKTGYDVNTSSLAIFLQEIESKILIVLKNKLEEYGNITRVPIHDANWFEEINKVDDLLTVLKDEISKELDMSIPLDYDDVKPTDEDIKWFEEHKKFYIDNKLNNKKFYEIENGSDDVGASHHIIKKYNDRLMKCEGILYVNVNNIWLSNDKDVKNALHNMIEETEIRYYGGDGKTTVHYNRSKKNIKNCIDCILPSDKIMVDDKFYNNIIKTTKYYLPFNNGVYSFLDKKFYTYEEKNDLKFIQKIKYDFPEFNQDDYDELMRRVIDPIYPDEIERDYNAHIRARAYAGCIEDKRWYGLIGEQNCGKGIETKLNQLAFEDYFGEFNTSDLLQKEDDYDAKQLAWIIPLRNCRVILANEVDKKKKNNASVSSKLIKSLASGGDKIKARLLHSNIIEFIPNFMMFFCANTGLKIDEENMDLLENYEEFSYKSKFVSSEELDKDSTFYKLKDDNIKSLIEEPRIYNAYLHYVLNNFTNPRQKTPECVKLLTDLSKGDLVITVDRFIVENFKPSKDKDDRLHTEEITRILNNNDYKINNIECGRLMSRMKIGTFNEKCTVKGIRKSGYEGIKYLGANDEV